VIGTRTELAEKYTPEQLADEWKHGLPMLAGRIVNEIDDDDTLGQSDYDQVRDQFLALNEATTIAYENARLTAKDRVFVAGSSPGRRQLRHRPRRLPGRDQEGSTLGEGDGRPPIVAMEKTFDAAPLIAHHKHLEQIALTRVGLVVQLVGESVGGHAETGAAIKLRYLPTINAAKGKAREWVGLPTIVDLGLRIRGLKVEEGGFGDTYLDQGLPSIERADGIPVDEGEDIRTHATAVAGEIESRQTAIQALHPDWDETRCRTSSTGSRPIRTSTFDAADSFTEGRPVVAARRRGPPDNAEPASAPGRTWATEPRGRRRKHGPCRDEGPRGPSRLDRRAGRRGGRLL
jgi:hypothetical protein